jgi:hypothetical protein
VNQTPQQQVRIVIYGTGQYGCHIARLASERGWTIVAAFNRAGDKIGQDLGHLAGLDRPLGVIIKDCDTASYDNLNADIGIVTLSNILSVNYSAHQRLLSAGMNVLCHGSESYYPYGCDPEIAARIDALAKANKVSFSGGGIWDMSRIWSGILLLGPCTQIKSLEHSSITDVYQQVSSFEQAGFLGIGISQTAFYEQGLHKAPFGNSYKTICEHVLSAVGYTVRGSEVTIAPVIYDTPINNPWSGDTIPAGTSVGTRISGHSHTEEGVSAHFNIELRLLREGEEEHVYWAVDGSPRNELRNARKDSDLTTAGCLFNRIPDVINAKPGIVLISEMGPLRSSAPRRNNKEIFND